jgi:hypothetical protein
MKLSNKIIIGVLITVAVLIITLVGYLRVSIGEGVNIQSVNETQDFWKNKETATFQMEGFDRIETIGYWNVSITPSKTWSVQVTASKDLLERVEVTKQENTLRCVLPKDSYISLRNHHLSLTVTMPSITAFHCAGGTDLQIQGFTSPELKIQNDGAARIIAKDCVIGSLTLAVSGAGDFDFTKSQIKNADITLSGAGQIRLTMTGGILSGKLSGAGRVAYSGKVSKNTLTDSGFSSIDYVTKW